MPKIRQQIREKRLLKDVLEETDYVKVPDVFRVLDGLAEKLEAMMPLDNTKREVLESTIKELLESLK